MVEATPDHRRLVRRMEDGRRWTATTPGRLRMFSVAIAGTAIALLAVGSAALITALATVSSIQQRTVPAIVGMEHIHAWLADADRSAASVYLAGGADSGSSQLEFDAESAATNLDVLGRLNPDDSQLRYQADVAAASRELQRATAQTPEGDERAQRLQEVGVALANYTRLVKTASAEAGQDVAAGAVYLQAASNLMHGPGGILAQVDQLQVGYAKDLDRANLVLQITAGAVALYAGVGIALLVLLVRTQRFVRLRFRRRRNNRLLAASLLVVIVVAGGGVGTVRAAEAIRAAEDQAYARLLNLWNVRTLVYDASGNESLSLIARGRSAQFDQAFRADTAQLVDRPLTDQLVVDAERGQVDFNGLLADELRASESTAERESALHALRAYQQFLAADAALRAQADAAARAPAARGSRPGTTTRPVLSDRPVTAAVGELDWYLGASMQILQGRFDAGMGSAQLTLGLVAALEVLTVAAAALAFWGVQPRIDEYAA